jgi:CBS domain-containing protein
MLPPPLAGEPERDYGLPMRISDVIRRKGDQVVTVRADATVRQLLELLEEHGIGAVVVSNDGSTVTGIVSERDVVRHLHNAGAGLLDQTVATIMTSEVHTVSPGDDIEDLARMMTDLRVRHVPVVVDDKLVAIVSIGDVVKSRIDELKTERDHLVDYIQQ